MRIGRLLDSRLPLFTTQREPCSHRLVSKRLQNLKRPSRAAGQIETRDILEQLDTNQAAPFQLRDLSISGEGVEYRGKWQAEASYDRALGWQLSVFVAAAS